jgi:hypothetical protein
MFFTERVGEAMIVLFTRVLCEVEVDRENEK